MNLQSGAIISLVITLIGAVGIYEAKHYAWIGDQTGYAPVQPIDFSHKVHAKDNAIPCEFCHFGARRGPIAGIPPASVCMSCHLEVRKDSPEVRKIVQAIESRRPIEWVRVHDLPDFVRFDHHAHVRRGVSCQTCHGAVETMARVEQVHNLSMGWCVGCHRDSTRYPPEGFPNVQASVECSVCHY